MPADNLPTPPEDLTLSGIIRLLVRRRVIVVGVFLTVLTGSIVLTLVSPKEYEAKASLLVLNEKDAVIALLQSEAFAASVAESNQFAHEIGGGNRTLAAKALMDRVTIRANERGAPANLVIVEAKATTGNDAAELANVYVSTLDTWRGFLVNVTHETQWSKYYEQSGKDSERAESQLRNLTEEMQYVQVLDVAAAPKSPASPVWSLNLALGAVLGVMSAVVAPFVVGAIEDGLKMRREEEQVASTDARNSDVEL